MPQHTLWRQTRHIILTPESLRRRKRAPMRSSFPFSFRRPKPGAPSEEFKTTRAIFRYYTTSKPIVIFEPYIVIFLRLTFNRVSISNSGLESRNITVDRRQANRTAIATIRYVDASEHQSY